MEILARNFPRMKFCVKLQHFIELTHIDAHFYQYCLTATSERGRGLFAEPHFYFCEKSGGLWFDMNAHLGF